MIRLTIKTVPHRTFLIAALCSLPRDQRSLGDEQRAEIRRNKISERECSARSSKFCVVMGTRVGYHKAHDMLVKKSIWKVNELIKFLTKDDDFMHRLPPLRIYFYSSTTFYRVLR